MASTGSTDGYLTDNYMSQGATQLNIGGMLKMFANASWRWPGSTYATGSTIPSDGLSVVRGTGGQSFTLSSPKQGGIGLVVVTNASSGAVATVGTGSTAILLDGVNDTLQFNAGGGILIYAPSTSEFQIVASHPDTIAGTSELVITGTS